MTAWAEHMDAVLSHVRCVTCVILLIPDKWAHVFLCLEVSSERVYSEVSVLDEWQVNCSLMRIF